MTAFIQDNLGPIVGLLVILLIVGLGAAALAWRRAAEIDRRLQALTRGDDGRSLQAVLEAQLGRVDEIAGAVDRLAGRTRALEVSGRKAFQRIGLVRFNPFEDTGSNQSFALALLDGRGDGFVVSSLHARAGTRVYAKAISNGVSEGALSDEETEALRQALAKPVPGGSA